MQTAQRRIPIGGDGGNMKHWSELLPKYEQELANLKKNIAMLKAQAAGTYKMKAEDIKPLKDATQQKGAFQMENINGEANFKMVKIAKGAKLFSDLDSVVTDFAPELAGMNAYVMNSSKQRGESTSLTFTTKKPVQLLIGYFRDDQMKYAKAPKLETDATATITVRQSHSSPVPSASTACHRSTSTSMSLPPASTPCSYQRASCLCSVLRAIRLPFVMPVSQVPIRRLIGCSTK